MQLPLCHSASLPGNCGVADSNALSDSQFESRIRCRISTAGLDVTPEISTLGASRTDSLIAHSPLSASCWTGLQEAVFLCRLGVLGDARFCLAPLRVLRHENRFTAAHRLPQSRSGKVKQPITITRLNAIKESDAWGTAAMRSSVWARIDRE